MYKRGDIYYVDFGNYERGSEQGGVRPAVIISNDIGNKNSSIVIVAPITTQTKTEIPTHVLLNKYSFLDSNSIILMEQITTKDKIFVRDYIGKLNDIDTFKLDHHTNISLQLYDNNSNFKHNIDLKIGALKELKGYINRHILKFNETDSIKEDIKEYNYLFYKFKKFCKENNIYYKLLYNEYINIQ